MHDSKTGRTSLRIDNLEAALEQGIENETGALEVLVVAAGKGNPHPELWRKLHMAAARDDRFSELAFAYERMCADRRVTALPAPIQSDILMHAATFFADTFSDPVGARSYLERVVTIAPGRMDAFLRLEQILTEAHEGVKLADLYAAVAMHRPERADQLELLRRAAKILDALPDEQDRAVKVLQQILKVEPGDPAARRGLEAVLVRAGKLGELARMRSRRRATK